jgi:D-glycero-D-manno-heptose 1,7-bisphosphate phosphatase
MRPFVILDRDGTLIEEKNYLADPGGVELLSGAAEAVERFGEMGYGVIVVTNQSGVGRGYFEMEDVERVNARMLELLGEAGKRVERIYICPHAPEEGCGCRKPRTGLVEQAARELGLDASRSVVIGDKAADVELARNAGASAVLVTTGYGAEAARGGVAADYVAADLKAAAEWVRRRGARRD